MVYSTESAKWKAYQFSDPFAAGLFLVCNKMNKFFCRPDCDARPPTGLKSEIEYAANGTAAINMGYIPCSYCDPLSLPTVDVNLLLKCVVAVNNQIGFLPPFVDENEDRNLENMKTCILDSKKGNINPATGTSVVSIDNKNDGLSSPILNFEGKGASLSKNDSDHYKLVDLACRHLALAAAVNIYQPQSTKGSISAKDNSEPLNSSKKRRRRGGVLGFKELAAKSKLSAWHFHRVFKSVTGLTPKTYGDKCWEFIKNHKESSGEQLYIPQKSSPPTSSYTSPLQTPPSYQTPVSSTFTNEKPSSPSASTSPDHHQFDDDQPPSKKIKIEPSYWIGKSSENLNMDNEIGLEMSQPPLSSNNFNIVGPEISSIPNQAFNGDIHNRFNSIATLPNDISQVSFNNSFNQPELFPAGFENNKTTYNRVSSAPNLSSYSKFPSTLFEQTQISAGPTEFVESLKQEMESPIINEVPTSIEEIFNDTTPINDRTVQELNESVVDMNSDHFYEFQKFVDDGVNAQCFNYYLPQEEYNMNSHVNSTSIDSLSMNERNDDLNNQDIGLVGLCQEKLTTHIGY
ncbi:uncharacterized protein RJT20DRAFT_7132 [Scheffersomyces xylosifermentans]|uniref:uncharacterized protein n=1 Tax=Scheffersomyces xylosifermentans TaxID=1304137 RepID=UPI00315D4771